MVARLVFVCDVCGAVTDDHYATPVRDARFRARALGWTCRRWSRGGSKNKPGPDRMRVDLCPEHTYDMGLVQEPIRGRWSAGGVADPRPIRPPRPLRTTDEAQSPPRVTVTYKAGDGPYRLYTSILAAHKQLGTPRGTTEQIRREMFAPGVDFLSVAARWAIVETEHGNEATDNDESHHGGPGGRRPAEPGDGASADR